jgi:hypothetical protein
MVVYNKKVSKRRRKRNGSKRKITKPRNKRMNRSRQMGGAFDANGNVIPSGAARRAADPAVQYDPTSAAPLVQGVPPIPQQPDVGNEDEVTRYAGEINTTLGEAVRNQQGLCTNIKGAIGDLITRVKKCRDSNTPIDLSALLEILNTILANVVLLNGQCGGLGELLQELEERLIEAGCLRAGAPNEFFTRLTNIDPGTQPRLGPGPPAPSVPTASLLTRQQQQKLPLARQAYLADAAQPSVTRQQQMAAAEDVQPAPPPPPPGA